MSKRTHVLVVAVAIAATVLALRLRDPGATPTPAHHAFGRGSTVVMVHGLGSRPGHWLPTARHLARRHRVVLVDLPGHGDSPMPLPFSLERAADALARAIARESADPVMVVGHSLGGLVAVAAALEHPRRVLGLVLVETALRPQFDAAGREQMLDLLVSDYRGLLRSAYVSFGRDSAQGEALYSEVAALDSTMIGRWIRLALSADVSSRMRSLRAPVLAVLSARSWPPGEDWSQTAAELGYAEIPRVEPVRFEGCGHFVMLDRPSGLAEVIERFIAHPDGESIAARR